MRIILSLGIFGLLAAAQTAPTPRFDVASIKPSEPGGRGMFVRSLPGGRVSINNMTAKQLIVMAYRLQPFQVTGGASWMDSIHYDIEAKPDGPVKQDQWPEMLQGLLADRFQLVVRRETKEMGIYALVLAKKDGKLGPNLTESKEGGCTKMDPTKPPPRPEPGQQMRGCGSMMMSPRMITAYGVPLERLTSVLSRSVGRTVIDKTGLTGNYDVKLEYTPDEAQLAMMAPPGAAPPPPPADPNAPSLFTALQEQLGLKLESQKGPVEIFVIEKAEKPSDN